MSDTRVKTISGWKDALGSKDGKQLVISGGETKLYTTTGAAAISKATTVVEDYPARDWKIRRLEVTFSTAPTTSENFTVTRSILNKSAGERPLTVLFSQDPSATSATSILQIWEDGIAMQAGDEVTIAYTNTDTRTVTAELEVEVL